MKGRTKHIKELELAGVRVLTASPEERTRIKRRLCWLANIQKDKHIKKLYTNAYRGIK